MLEGLAMALFVLANLAALLLVPLGFPGTFLQVAAALVMTVAAPGGRFGWGWVGVLLALALAGEAVEFLSGQWGARRFGGSRRAAWGALIGGVAGAVVGGIPIPVLGSIVASFVGTFAGAMAGEMLAQRAFAPDLRVGLGAVVGRVLGVGTKLFLAVVMMVVGIATVLRAG